MRFYVYGKSQLVACDVSDYSKNGRMIGFTTQSTEERYLHEVIAVVFISEERDGVSEHPDVASSAVVVRFTPFSILIFYRQDLVRHPSFVCCVVVSVRVETWGETVFKGLTEHIKKPPQTNNSWVTEMYNFSFCCFFAQDEFDKQAKAG